MQTTFPKILRDDLDHTVREAIYRDGIVNVLSVAAKLQDRHADANVAMEDIEHLVMGYAQLYGSPIEFDRTGGDLKPPVSRSNGGLLIELITEDFEIAA